MNAGQLQKRGRCWSLLTSLPEPKQQEMATHFSAEVLSHTQERSGLFGTPAPRQDVNWEMGKSSSRTRAWLGSCSSMGRATTSPLQAWAVVAINAQNGLEKAFFGPVWFGHAQRSSSAEWVAYSVAHQVSTGPSTIYSDYLSVVMFHQKGMLHLLRSSNIFGAMAKSTLSDPLAGHIKEVAKVKAHQDLSCLEGQELRLAIGNTWADTFAKKGARMHEGPTDHILKQVAQHVEDTKHVACLVANLWAMWPPTVKAGERKPRKKTTRKARAKHQWASSGRTWQCKVCLTFVQKKSTRLLAALNKRPCKAKTLEEGHEAVNAWVEGTRIVFCSRCGAWYSARRHKFRSSCGAPTEAGKKARRKLVCGLHPQDGRPLVDPTKADGSPFAWLQPATTSRGTGRARPKPELAPLVVPEPSQPATGPLAADRLAAVRARVRARLEATSSAEPRRPASSLGG